jgi:hypothetical protein
MIITWILLQPADMGPTLADAVLSARADLEVSRAQFERGNIATGLIVAVMSLLIMLVLNLLRRVSKADKEREKLYASVAALTERCIVSIERSTAALTLVERGLSRLTDEGPPH